MQHTHSCTTYTPVLSNTGVCHSSIDTSAAECLPGVVCCVFADDIPGSNATGPIEYDETVFAHHQVCFLFLSDQSGDSVRFMTMLMMFPSCLQVTCVGHIIGAVVADTQLHAQRAAKAVRIQYEELQPIITIQVRPATPGPLLTTPVSIFECKNTLLIRNRNLTSKTENKSVAGLTGSHCCPVLLSANQNHRDGRPGGGI